MSSGYSASLERFQLDNPEMILGSLVRAIHEQHAELLRAQTEAWTAQTEILKRAAAELIRRRPDAAEWPLLIEYEIPRRGRRIDAVVLANGTVVVTEFKVGATAFERGAVWQVEDYALDLRDFHEASRGRMIFPVLVATAAQRSTNPRVTGADIASDTLIAPVSRIVPGDLAHVALEAAARADGMGVPPVDGTTWEASPYNPSLNIIEAAEEIFAHHHVQAISHAAAENLAATTTAIMEAIRKAHALGRRAICFVTGVPGAGKTLTGLSAVHDPQLREEGRTPGVFLSGNGPLIKIVRSALVRDLKTRGQATQEDDRKIRTFILNVHQFLAEYVNKRPEHAPPEHVIIFDEAQRAWDAAQVRLKRQIDRSEPEMVLDVMERCAGWCVVVALVGGGQEINRGEAGLAEWGRALAKRSVSWDVLASPEVMAGGSSVANQRLFESATPASVVLQHDERLHLRTSVRSIRSQVVAEWVNAVLEGEAGTAHQLLSTATEFPVAMTRDLDLARSWLRARAGAMDRAGLCGLVASSGALRLRAYGIEVSPGFRRGFQYAEWFLAQPADIRSAERLEVAATEFECQGLELDWVGVCWGDDLTKEAVGGAWVTRRFAGSRWFTIRDKDRRRLAINKYRVLLTRARKGMILWVPQGSSEDPTRDSSRMDETAEFLRRCGIPEILDHD